VMSGLMDVSLQLGKECLETSSAELVMSSTEQSTETDHNRKKAHKV
jgi:hypothetical protein